MKPSYEELEARCAAIVAENAGLKEKMNKLATWPGIEFYSSAWEFNNSDGNAALEYMCDTETPATDAFLAEVRAQVWIEAKDFTKSMLACDSVDHLDFLFDGNVQQLRQGVQS